MSENETLFELLEKVEDDIINVDKKEKRLKQFRDYQKKKRERLSYLSKSISKNKNGGIYISFPDDLKNGNEILINVKFATFVDNETKARMLKECTATIHLKDEIEVKKAESNSLDISYIKAE